MNFRPGWGLGLLVVWFASLAPAPACAQFLTSKVASGHVPVSAIKFVAIMGQVARPGVYEMRTADPQLTELVQRAGGLAPEASGSIRLIRHARTGQQVFYSPGLSYPLMHGDLLIAEPRLGGPGEARRAPIDRGTPSFRRAGRPRPHRWNLPQSSGWACCNCSIGR